MFILENDTLLARILRIPFFRKSYKLEEIVESRYRQSPEETRNSDEYTFCNVERIVAVQNFTYIL